MIIKPIFTQEHAFPIVASWHHQEWGHFHPGRSEQDLLNNYKKTYQQNNQLPAMWVYILDKKIVGTIEFTKHDMTNHEKLSPWLASLYVDKRYRNQQIGRKLVLFILNHAKNLNYKQIYLFTPDKIKFYSYFGFEKYKQVSYKNNLVMIMKKIF